MSERGITPGPTALAERARQHLANLAAAPRPAGSDAEATARRYSAGVLALYGFTTSEIPFEYSALPGRWATPLAGLGSIGTLAAAGHVGARGGSVGALAILGAALLIGVPTLVWVARRGVLQLPVARARGVNLRAMRADAVRADGDPTVWLVAHLDSKSQPIPIALRAVAIIASAIVWIAAFALALGQIGGAPVAGWWIWIAVAGAIAGLPVAATVVGGRSHGAVDNASGVASALLAAELLAPTDRVGVLLTSGEELGLAGARAAATSFPRAAALNCDTVDDDAPMLCLTTHTGAGAADAIVAAAHSLGIPVTRRRLLPGILVDAVALADAGWDCATLSAATWRTLARVHTSRDRIEALRGEAVGRAGEILARAARELIARAG